MNNQSKNVCLSVDQLIGYTKNSVTPDQEKLIKKHLSECSLCKEAVEGIQMSPDKDNVKTIVDSLNTEIHHRIRIRRYSKKHPLNQWKVYYSIAALLLITFVFSLYLFNATQSHEQIFAEYFEPYPNTTPLLRDESPATTLQKAMVEYEINNYEGSLKILETINSDEPDFLKAYFYLGISNLYLDHTQKAFIYLQVVVEANNNDLKEAALWYLGLAYLKNKNIEQARSTFQKIISINGIYRQKSVQLLQEELFKEPE